MGPTETSRKAWLQLNQLSARLISAVEDELKRADLPPLIWHTTLTILQQAGETGLRQFQIGRELAMAQHNLSRLCDRMEKAGYITKEPCPEDNRGLTLVITKTGADQLQNMQPVYSTAIQEHFAKHLSGPEIVSLSHLLDRFPNETEGEARSGMTKQ